MALTVAEIIAELQKHPEFANRVPVVYDQNSNESFIDGVEIDTDNNDLLITTDSV